ncbi:Uncharacterized protein involved in outer membrane biogenesis [Pseudomonas cuatrocienegasensis]|uniref:Uncharacterized protein involved in outer membrane biogenesis n=1 Tax=Pseudomonas cuatrocienegasensis TaxID=543360 RepID=A0ABY1BLD4_9PSED|nr:MULTISPECIES: DUF748 domain-containing protein [Pseudomonas]OEC34339.1 hypothetical protein A7D25_14120 [Pseudomonas sp. 21C1]SER10910.1 Uncharacterized protein involved in outer membrane biogenesis [Pseudomonas cuatrocienegasensis]
MYKAMKRLVSVLLLAVLLYSLLGFLILPGIALRIANQQLAEYSNVPASLERLQFNPFSLELDLWGLRMGEPQAPQLAFARLHANLQLDSLWRGALHLADVELQQPQVELRFAKDGTLNLAQLFKLPPSAEPTATEEPSEPFPLQLDRLQLSGGDLYLQDLRPSSPVELRYDDLTFELHNLSTRSADDAEMTLVASGPDGGRLDWSGTFGLTPIRSSGSLKISDGPLHSLWPYVSDAVPLTLAEGAIDLAADYQLSLAEGTQLLLKGIQIKLAPFALQASDGRPLLKLASLEVADSSLDLAKRQVVVGSVRSQQLETWAAREADGQLDWQKLFAAEPSPPATANSATVAPATAADTEATTAQAEAPWQVRLRDMQLRDSHVHLADRVPEQAVALDLGPLNLSLQDFDSNGTSPFNLQLDTGVGKQGRLSAEGQVQLTPTTAQLKVSSQDIDLRVAQAYLSPFVRLELRSGLLGSDLDVTLESTAPLALRVTGAARISQLHTLDTLKERDFVRWKQLDLAGLNYRHGELLSIDSVRLEQPYGRFIINEDLTTNASELLIAQAKPAAPSEGAPLGVRIGQVDIHDGSANFADFSLTPNFATAVQQLNGRIGTLDNRAGKPASVNIAGKVDRYAPVSIKGSLNPFDPLASLDIATQFKQVELTTLTPYSGKFAGYRIRKGRLNLDLHYRIRNGQLDAENKVVVEQLQLGEKVDSPSAVDLPIRLAVALLKDSDGKIALELPLKGDLNSPDFDVMPIVWQTLRNLVLRAAQAPFKFIGGLVSGGAEVDLSSVPFAPGSDELDANARSRLDTLSAALKARPALRLEIEGMSAAQDGPVLAAQRLEREYQRTYYAILQRRGDKVPASAGELQVADDEKPALLEGIYRARLKQQPPAEWAELDDDQRTEQLQTALLQSWGASELMQRQLAQARGARIKEYLVDQGGLEDMRLYLLDVSLGQADADGRVATPLHLDSE